MSLSVDAEDHRQFVHKLRSAIQSRDYLSAKSVCDSYATDHEQKKIQQLAELEKLQHTERIRLASAKSVALRRAASAGQMLLAQREAEMGERQSKVQSVHDDKLQLLTMSMRDKENSKPMVYSTSTNQLRQAEKHLARLRMFDEAAVAKAKLLQREALEKQRVARERERKLRDVLEIRHQQFLDDERTLYTRMKGELEIEKGRMAAETLRVNTTYDHLSKDMERAHSRQKMLCARTTSTDLETVLASGTGQQSRAVRGTAMLRRVKGNRFTIPSLCDMYGSLLESPSRSADGRPHEFTRGSWESVS